MSAFHYFIQYFYVIICSIGLIILVQFNRGVGSARIRNAMIGNAIFTMVLSIVDYIERFSVDQVPLIPLRTTMSILGYLLRVLPLYSLILVMRRRRANHELYLALPLMIDVLFCITTPFTGWVFRYDEVGLFIRGPLGFLPHAVGVFYLAMFLYYTMELFYNRYIKEAIIMLFVVSVAIIALVLETANDAYGLITVAYAAGNLMYYMFIHTQIASHDSLTTLLTRASFYEDCKRYKDDIAGFISIDMNELKWINDTLGHAAGDKALATVSDCIKDSMGSQFPAYRLGGDEFCAIIWKKYVDKADAAAELFRIKLGQTEYSCAVGVAYNTGDEKNPRTPHDLLREADRLMYENKEQMKEKARAEGKILHPRQD